MAAPEDADLPAELALGELRRQLDPDPAAVARIVRTALAAPPSALPTAPSRDPRPRRLRLAGAVASFALVATALYFVARPSRTGDGRDTASITSVGGIVVARSPRQAVWFVRSQAPEPPAPSILIVRHGGGS